MRGGFKYFLEKAEKVHGKKYNYSKVEYKDSITKVCIICPEHGEFWQTPQSHLRGYGCPLCGNKKKGATIRLTSDEFVKKSVAIHGDKYDYSKVNYVNSNTKVCIICPEHGEFWMRPLSHIYDNKQGCPKCIGRGFSRDEMVERFRHVHGDTYDYSQVVLGGSKDKVCIICKKHGEFLQTPQKHLSGQGCPLCGIERRSAAQTKTTEQFIEEAKMVHGDKYDYSKTIYRAAQSKVKIICPEHGEFEQKPCDHLNGHGCRFCCESRLEREVENCLANNSIEFSKQHTFDWLGRQSLDFYLPDYNVAIECQGGQHFHPIEHFGGIDAYEITKERDERKKRLLEEHGIKLLYFASDDFGGCFTNGGDLVKEIVSCVG